MDRYSRTHRAAALAAVPPGRRDLPLPAPGRCPLTCRYGTVEGADVAPIAGRLAGAVVAPPPPPPPPVGAVASPPLPFSSVAPSAGVFPALFRAVGSAPLSSSRRTAPCTVWASPAAARCSGVLPSLSFACTSAL